MKKMKLLIVLLFPILGFSQPVLTNGIIPTFGSQYEAQFIEKPNFNPGPAGANQIWDFSNLQGQLEIHFNILDPKGTPETDEFPNASFVWNIVEFESFFYYSIVDDGISQMGTAVANEMETTFLVINSDLEDAIQFPITFGTSYNYQSAYDNYLFGSLIFSGQRDGTLTADSYGTLITPFGTYEDVLRLKIVTTEFGINSTQYAWYMEDSFIPLLVYESSDDPEETTSLYYTSADEMVSTEEESIENSIRIHYVHNSNSIIMKSQKADAKIDDLFLYSIDGNLIQKGTNNLLNHGHNELSFPLKQYISSGLYVLKYTQDGIPKSTSLFIGRP